MHTDANYNNKVNTDTDYNTACFKKSCPKVKLLPFSQFLSKVNEAV